MSKVHEWFGYPPASAEARAQFHAGEECPFIPGRCTKTFADGTVAGVCSIWQQKAGAVVCCPNRLYGNDYRILHDVAADAFGPSHPPLVTGNDVAAITAQEAGGAVAVFGKRWGGELRLPQRSGIGAYFVDWILALLDGNGDLQSFVAVEVQTIDTTGSYREAVEALRGSKAMPEVSVGLNWENVNKRILPQIIYKGHVLRGEPRCSAGLYFVSPTPVHNKIIERLAGTLKQYQKQPGAVTFMRYDMSEEPPYPAPISQGGLFTTTVDQVALAFTAPTNLPPNGVYEKAIRSSLK